ncbi:MULTISPECIES: peptide deformylase [Paenibacillus]|uniref:peptide deformylase n=1 Tax=Paenibacillus TaxID=44249 RepID=UPI0022B8BF6F|nr:peptide deformylase [Paenibacillus caseinilyticus]MCZ8518110.1 peptide deformylase [Paenibacillus caseinilyticus]
MAEKMIRRLGDPVLREKCRPVPGITPSVLKLLGDLKETLYAEPGRAGLAAPQIGIAKRVAVLDMGEGLIELINPEIVEKSGEQTSFEGCLSLPKLYGSVKRAQTVRVKTLNREGQEVFLDAEGHTAVCMQHEIDHLDGILYIDYVKDGELFNEETEEKVSVWEAIRESRSGQL